MVNGVWGFGGRKPPLQKRENFAQKSEHEQERSVEHRTPNDGEKEAVTRGRRRGRRGAEE
jgi:hypothetical protein